MGKSATQHVSGGAKNVSKYGKIQHTFRVYNVSARLMQEGHRTTDVGM